MNCLIFVPFQGIVYNDVECGYTLHSACHLTIKIIIIVSLHVALN